ncbi:hypothetical protein LKO27_08310 [Tessaracoccus sp. OS52]|uniref:hypothetical protein n=1 Tax=Tessaracoccus sp. OS52 TaxID=2886691 RepID=UPI001D129A2F|nr:hypothetical protein [Tessaracoccus sp. OS52]MCC2593409.1 hypothetical protein [Tessaracoccus sp. OS52]
MTAMMSLRSRLALAKLALHARSDQLDVDRLAPLINAGVDLLVLGGTGDEAADAGTLRAFREVYARTPLLLATDNGDAAEEASADVVHLVKPGWKLWGSYPKGHEWTLLGRHTCDARTVRKPGDDWDYLFVGPLREDEFEAHPLREALAEQPPFAADALPWFALGAFQLSAVENLLGMGVRRIALTGDVLDAAEPVASVAGIRAALNRAWDNDEAARAYRLSAAAL